MSMAIDTKVPAIQGKLLGKTPATAYDHQLLPHIRQRYPKLIKVAVEVDFDNLSDFNKERYRLPIRKQGLGIRDLSYTQI